AYDLGIESNILAQAPLYRQLFEISANILGFAIEIFPIASSTSKTVKETIAIDSASWIAIFIPCTPYFRVFLEDSEVHPSLVKPVCCQQTTFSSADDGDLEITSRGQIRFVP